MTPNYNHTHKYIFRSLCIVFFFPKFYIPTRYPSQLLEFANCWGYISSLNVSFQIIFTYFHYNKCFISSFNNFQHFYKIWILYISQHFIKNNLILKILLLLILETFAHYFDAGWVVILGIPLDKHFHMIRLLQTNLWRLLSFRLSFLPSISL